MFFYVSLCAPYYTVFVAKVTVKTCSVCSAKCARNRTFTSLSVSLCIWMSHLLHLLILQSLIRFGKQSGKVWLKAVTEAKPNYKMTTWFKGLWCGTINELCRVTVITRELMLSSTARANKQKHFWLQIFGKHCSLVLRKTTCHPPVNNVLKNMFLTNFKNMSFWSKRMQKKWVSNWSFLLFIMKVKVSQREV